MFTRHIDVKNNLVFINSLENILMNLDRLPKEVLFYIEIEDYWRVETEYGDSYPLNKPTKDTRSEEDWAIREIALEILDEAVILWEQERGIKFDPDMDKDYRKFLKEQRIKNGYLIPGDE